MGGANQNAVGVIVGTTVDAVMEVVDYGDASASYAPPIPNQHPGVVADLRAPTHQAGTLDDEGVAVENDVSRDGQEGVVPFHNDHSNRHGMIEVDTSEAVDTYQVGKILADNNHEGAVVDVVQEVDVPIWIDVVIENDVLTLTKFPLPVPLLPFPEHFFYPPLPYGHPSQPHASYSRSLH